MEYVEHLDSIDVLNRMNDSDVAKYLKQLISMRLLDYLIELDR